jgi:hypothetical protein
MHAGFSFSYSPISLLLRQPLSIKKSYAGAIQKFPNNTKSFIFYLKQNRTLSSAFPDDWNLLSAHTLSSAFVVVFEQLLRTCNR